MEKGSKSRRSAAEMELLVKKWEQSGRSRAEFCREEGIPSWIFQYWLGRYRDQRSTDSDKGFTEIRVNGDKSGSGSIKIKHPCGIEVELSQGTSALYLRELLGW